MNIIARGPCAARSVFAVLAVLALFSPRDARAEDGASGSADGRATKSAAAPDATQPAVQAALKRSENSGVVDVGSGGTGATAIGGQGGGPVDAKATRLASIGGTTTAQANASAGGARVIAAPKSNAAVAPSVIERPHRGVRGSAVTDAAGVIATMSPSFVACAKGADKDAAGTAILSANVTGTGEVAAAVVLASGGMTPSTIACFRDVVSKAKFVTAGGRGAAVQVRVTPHELSQTVASR